MDRVSAGSLETVARAGLFAAVAMAIGGCAQIRTVSHDVSEATHIRPLGVDPSSPVAADVERAEKSSGPIPTFASVPPKLTDVRPVAAYKAQVVDVVGERRALARADAAAPPPVSDTEAYVASQRARVAGEVAVTPERQAESDAFARKLQAAAGQPSAQPAPAKPAKAMKKSKSGPAPTH